MSVLLAAALFGVASVSATPPAAPAAPTKPVLLVLTSHGIKGSSGEPTGFYLSEVTHPLAVFDAAGIAVEFASIQGGEPPVDGVNLEDPTNARYWQQETFRKSIRDTQVLDAVDPQRYSAVFYAGGHGTMWDFPDSPAVKRITRDIYQAGGVVSAVCHGPAALVNVTLSDGSYLVAGKQVSAFTDEEERAAKMAEVVPFLLSTTLRERGAHHLAAPNFTAKVVVDGRLVTGQNPASATGVAQATVELLRNTTPSAEAAD